MDRLTDKKRAGQLKSFLGFCLAILSAPTFAAGVEVDGVSDTGLDKAPNGVRIVNIAKPNAGGLSHNTYKRFNVGSSGLILNNATKKATSTQLGGYILGNSRLTSPAKVILNEVTSTNRSTLRGYTEVAGPAADVVIANPNGLSINGAGFINARRVTLTTGTPLFDSVGGLSGLDVRGGDISISGNGLDSSQQDATSIYTHFLNLNADLYARDLDIALGENQIDYPGRKVVRSGFGIGKRVLLDSSALGGMYSGKIRLVGTAKGLGINLPPEVIASSGDIRVSNDGRIVLQQLDAAGDIVVDTKTGVDSSDTVFAKKVLDIEADEIRQSAGTLAASQTVTLDAEKIDIRGDIVGGLEQDGGFNGWGQVSLLGATFDNFGAVSSAGSIDLEVSNIANTGLINAGGNLTISANDLLNQETIFAGGDMQLFVRDRLDNLQGAAIFSVDNLILAADRFDQKTRLINNDLGLIQTDHGDIDVLAIRFDNIGLASLRYDTEYYDLGRQRVVSKLKKAKALNLGYHSGYTKHRSEARKRWIDEVLSRLERDAPHLYSDNKKDIRSLYAKFDAIETRLIDKSTTTPALLDSGGNLSLQVDRFENRDSIVSAANDIDFDIGDSYANQASSKSLLVTDYKYYTHAKHKSNSSNEDRYSSKGRSGYLPVKRTKKITSNTVTQAGGAISGSVGGKAVNSGVLRGHQQLNDAIDSADYGQAKIQLPDGEFGLFIKSVKPDSRYLIETNPRFTRYSEFAGSSYLLDRLDFSASTTLKRLGDALYESKLIRDSVFALSGKRYLNTDIESDTEQFQYLMENALTAQRELNLAPGVALTRKQIDRLGSDIVWLVPTDVEGQTVLAPRVYLASTRHAQVRGGQIVAGDGLDLKVAQLINSGAIESGESLALNSDDAIINSGALHAGGELKLMAVKDIDNVSGRIEADSIAIASSHGDVTNRRASEEYSYSAHNIRYSTEIFDEASQIAALEDLRIEAAGEIRVEGSVIEGNSVELDADEVDIGTFAHAEDFHIGSKSNYAKGSSTRHFASSVSGGDIVIISRGKTRVSGSSVEAQRNLRIEAGSIDVAAVNDSDYLERQSTDKDTFSSKVKNKKRFRSRNLGGELNGATVVLITERGDIELTGSEIEAGTRLSMQSVGDIRIAAGQDGSLDETHERESGWFSGGSLYREKEDLDGRIETTASNSRIRAGSVDLSALDTIDIEGADVAVAGEFTANADIISLRNTSDQVTRYSKHTEIEVDFGDAVKRLADIDDFVETDDGKLTLALAEADFERMDSVTTEEIALASRVEAGSIRMSASPGGRGEIQIQGSDLVAAEDIELVAGSEVSVIDAHHVMRNDTSSQTGSATFNLTLQNEYDQAARAIKAVKQAERDLRRTQDDYSQYKRELAAQESAFEQLQAEFADGTGFIERADIRDFERQLDRLRDDKEFYKTNIALAAVTLTSKTTQLIKQTGRAAASSKTAGFNLSAELDIDALEREIEEYYRHSRASSLVADNIRISAGDSASVRGSNLQAQDSIEISAGKISVLAGVDTSNSREREQHVNYTHTWDALSGDLGGDPVQVQGAGIDPQNLGGDIGGDGRRSDDETTRYINSQLHAGNIILSASSDTTIEGADIHAEENLEVSAGNLSVASVQDSSYGETRSQGLSYSGAGSGLNSGKTDSESVQTNLTRLTGGQVTVVVDKHTELTGAVIAAIDADGNDNGQLKFSTDTLNASSLNNLDDIKDRSAAFQVGELSNLELVEETEYRKTKSLATLGSGEIQIADGEGSDTRFLNTDIENTEVTIADFESHKGLAVELDTRLLSAEGRRQIAEDWIKTGMIANTVELIAATDRVGIEDIFSETKKFHATYQAVKQQVGSDPQLAAMLQDSGLAPEQKQQMLDQLVGAVMVQLGYEAHKNLLISTQDKTSDGEKFYGFYSEQSGSAYINDLEIEDTKRLIFVAGHEASHAIDYLEGSANSDTVTKLDIEEYADNFGNNLSKYANFSLDYHGFDSLAVANDHLNQGSSDLITNTNEFKDLDHSMGDFYCANSHACYGAETEALFRLGQLNPKPIAYANGYVIRESVASNGSITGYEAFNLETKNIIVMKPEELTGFIQIVESVPTVGYSLESMSIAEHASANALANLHDDGVSGGIKNAWMRYLSDPDIYFEAIVGIAGASSASKFIVSKESALQKIKFSRAYDGNKILNPLPRNGTFFRVMPNEHAVNFAAGKGLFGPPSPRNEVFIGAANDLKQVDSVIDAQRRLSLPSASGDAVLEFKLKDYGKAGLRSPIETRPNRGGEFIQGGKTKGGAREWNINNGTAEEIGVTEIKIKILDNN